MKKKLVAIGLVALMAFSPAVNVSAKESECAYHTDGHCKGTDKVEFTKIRGKKVIITSTYCCCGDLLARFVHDGWEIY